MPEELNRMDLRKILEECMKYGAKTGAVDYLTIKKFLDLCNAYLAKKMAGMEEIMLDVLYDRTPIGIKIHELMPEEIVDRLTQALQKYMEE